MSETTCKNRLNPLRALRQRDFRLLFAGQSISSLGSTFQAAALPWMILSQHGSALDLTLTLLALTLPQSLLTLIGGVFIDRFDARSIMIVADCLRVLTAGALALVAKNVLAHLWLMWFILALHGIGTAFFAPAAQTIAPFLVEEADLESANALTSGMTQIGASVGFFAIAPLLSLGGPALAFGLNACSYLVAVAMACLMRPLARVSPGRRGVMLQEIREAAYYLRSIPWLLGLLVIDSLLAFSAISINSIGLPLLAKSEQVGVMGYGLLAGGYYCGAIVGLFLSAWYPIRTRRGSLCILFHGAEAIFMMMVAFVPLPLNALCMTAWSTLNGILVVVTLSLLQQHTPTPFLGRIMAFWALSSIWMLPIAQLSGGLIVGVIGAKGLFVLPGILVLVSSVLGWSIPQLRHLN